MVAVAITNSLSLVGEELENTIEQAESELKAFLEERDNQDHLTACAELMHQVAGTFKIVALKGADALMRDVSELIARFCLPKSPHRLLSCRSILEMLDAFFLF